MGTGCFKDTTIQDAKQETTKENKTKVEQNKESIKTKEISQTDKPQQIEKTEDQIANISKSFCEIKLETESDTIIGTGFLLQIKIDKDKEPFYCLLSNVNVIKKDIINNNKNFYILYDNGYKYANIKLDTSIRYIKSFREEGTEIIVVEILNEDNISKDYFLLNKDETEINKLINSEIYIYQYTQDEEIVNTSGKIIKINKNEFTHLANTDSCSLGSPIFIKNTTNIIGIHKGSNEDKTENYGDLINPIINIIKEDIKKNNNGKYLDGKYIWEDGKYYIGEFKNDIPNGKGVKYHSNGDILYEGNFINGKFEGNGKYYYDNGYYFIGECKNGLRNGKGIAYYKNGNILYDGDWVNNEPEGNGKVIKENGDYYIGQFKNG